MMAGFTFLPRLYDALIGVVFPLGASDLAATSEVGPGNVLAPSPDTNGLDGRHGGPWVGVARNLATQLRRGRVARN
jgi:hypothetical protein